MKKHFSVLLAVLAAMAIFTSNVLAAPAEAKKVKLVSISYNRGGVVLIFETSDLTKDDLKNSSFFAASSDQDMFCNFIDDSTTVRCTVARILAGQGEFRGTLAGFGFSGKLPEAKKYECGDDETSWYNLNGYYNGELFGSGSIPVFIWDDAVSNGYIGQAASQGITYTITGFFCTPMVEPF